MKTYDRLMQKYDWVFVDLETTGLNPALDRIIEVAAVRLSGDGSRETFQRLVNPGLPVPEYITRLTGIDTGMVADAPSFEEIRAPLLRFLEGGVIVAHNAGFDVSFLQAALGHALPNNCVDTCDLARLLFPNVSSYSLRHLVRTLQIEEIPAHRALEDTLALEALFIKLMEKASLLSLPESREISCFLQGTENGLATLFEDILREKIKQYDFASPSPAKRKGRQAGVVPSTGSAGWSWDIGVLEKMFLPGGAVAGALHLYQKREQQVRMVKAVAKAFVQERHLLVEAGTGIGKSLAYLVPALAWACSHGEKVAVSTQTIALQEQLFRSEIDFLKKNTGIPFKAAVLKGRGNYICLRKWRLAGNDLTHHTKPEKILMARIGLWLRQDDSGDRDYINLRDWEADMYDQLASSGESCLGSKCPDAGECYYQKAKQAAQQADLVIVNHALLLADLKLNEAILPKYKYLVVDEAHHLEEEGTRQFSAVFSWRDFKKRISQLQSRRDLVKKPGLLFLLKQRLPALKHSGSELAGEIGAAVNEAQDILTAINIIFDETEKFFLEKQAPEVIRVREEVREQEWWRNLALLFDNLWFKTADLIEKLEQLGKRLAPEFREQDGEESLREQHAALDILKADCELVRRFFHAEQEPGMVYWLERDPARNDLRVYITPLRTDQIFHDFLFAVKDTVILTSATLSVEGNFAFLVEQLGIPPELADTLCLPSPFAYEEQALLLVDNSLPDPARTGEEGYNLAIAEALLAVLRVTGGNSLVLFTSHKQLRSMYERLAEPLRRHGLELFADGVNGRRNNLISELKNNSQAVVFGASAFWEGIDLPGRSLTALVIVRLPFNPPNLPLVEARSEELQKEGKNGFYHYSLPQAVLKFKQGYGRLIRTMDDCGVVVVLDNRLVSKNYGRTFLNSLPNYRHFAGSTKDLTRRIEEWFYDLKIKEADDD